MNNNLISDIKHRLTIEQLANRLGLTITHSNKIYSIYKKENTPSLQLYLKTNSFFDFSTGRGGDVIQLYQDYYCIDTKKAIKELAEIVGLRLNDNPDNEYRIQRDPLPVMEVKPEYELLGSEKDYFEERAAVLEYEGGNTREEAEDNAFLDIIRQRESIQLKIYKMLFEFCNSLGYEENAYEYLTGRDRGLTAAILKQFLIFTIHSVKQTREYLKDNFTKDELFISGLFTRKDYFVFTKHRIVIPFIEHGEVSYMRGRYFYAGSPKPEGFGKYIGLSNFATNLSSKRFYNYDIIHSGSLPAFSKLLITEGEFDCMAANQNGINAIGISGVSAFPKHLIKELDHYSIYLAMDSDEAGIKAAEEIANLFNKSINIIKLNNYKDLTELFAND